MKAALINPGILPRQPDLKGTAKDFYEAVIKKNSERFDTHLQKVRWDKKYYDLVNAGYYFKHK